MPTYEHHCQKCDAVFEVFQSIKDAPLTICTCGKKGRVKRLLGRGAGIIFKGSGFYETDYRRKPAPKVDGAKPGGEAAATKSPTPSPSAAPPEKK